MTKSINWKIKVGTTEYSAGPSGPHKIYVTYGAPSGSEVTERRVREVCTLANGKSGLQECANAVFDGLTATHGPGNWGPDPIWLLHDPSQTSLCPGMADFVRKHFQMLGLGDGALVYCYALADGTYESSIVAPTPATRPIIVGAGHHPAGTTHDDERSLESLAHFVSVAGTGYNNYQAALLFEGHYYDLGYSRDKTDAKGVVKEVFALVQWVYWTWSSVTGDWVWHLCTEDPWVEAP